MALCVGRAQRGAIVAACLPEVCPALSLFPVTSPTSHMQLAPFQLLPLNPRVGGNVYVLRPCGPFKRSLLKIQQFLLLHQPPLIFIARSYGGLSSQCWNLGLCGLSWGWDHSLPRYPSCFLSICECGTISFTATAISVPLSCLHYSAPPTSLDECGFFKSLAVRLPHSLIFWCSECYLFWDLVVILSVVAWGGEACLPTPPSWLEVP